MNISKPAGLAVMSDTVLGTQAQKGNEGTRMPARAAGTVQMKVEIRSLTLTSAPPRAGGVNH